MKIKQKCVRTYPRGFTSTTGDLDRTLVLGYRVVMCHAIGNEGILEYILEKEVEEDDE